MFACFHNSNPTSITSVPTSLPSRLQCSPLAILSQTQLCGWIPHCVASKLLLLFCYVSLSLTHEEEHSKSFLFLLTDFVDLLVSYMSWKTASLFFFLSIFHCLLFCYSYYRARGWAIHPYLLSPNLMKY